MSRNRFSRSYLYFLLRLSICVYMLKRRGERRSVCERERNAGFFLAIIMSGTAAVVIVSALSCKKDVCRSDVVAAV